MAVNSSSEAIISAGLKPSNEISAKEEALLAGLSPEDKVRTRAQLLLQKQQETVAFITKALKNDKEMQTINALR